MELGSSIARGGPSRAEELRWTKRRFAHYNSVLGCVVVLVIVVRVVARVVGPHRAGARAAIDGAELVEANQATTGHSEFLDSVSRAMAFLVAITSTPNRPRSRDSAGLSTLRRGL